MLIDPEKYVEMGLEIAVVSQASKINNGVV